MAVAAASSSTRISVWGNSDAVRIPRGALRAVGLASGDSVEVVVNERHNIELVPKQRAHRRIRPKKGVSFDTLFAGYEPPATEPRVGECWPDDSMVGAELDAWSR